MWGIEEGEAQDSLSELVRYSMLEWEAPRSVGLELGRYRLHDLVRDCADAWLGREGREAAERRHAAHYRQVLYAAEELYKQGGDGFVPAYMNLLGSGGSDSPDRLLAGIGVDVHDEGFWAGGLSLVDEMVTQAERLAETVSGQS